MKEPSELLTKGERHELLRRWRLFLYASRAYVDRFGDPKNIVELENHRIIVLGNTPNLYSSNHVQWSLKRGPGKSSLRPYITTNSLQAMYEMTRAGLDIGNFSPENELMQNTDLVPVLHEHIFQDVDLFFIYHESMASNSKVLAFKKFMFEHVKNEREKND